MALIHFLPSQSPFQGTAVMQQIFKAHRYIFCPTPLMEDEQVKMTAGGTVADIVVVVTQTFGCFLSFQGKGEEKGTLYQTAQNANITVTIPKR